jgi:hypothetical protein
MRPFSASSSSGILSSFENVDKTPPLSNSSLVGSGMMCVGRGRGEKTTENEASGSVDTSSATFIYVRYQRNCNATDRYHLDSGLAW